MNPFERWDDWEWERAAQEVGKEHDRGRSGSSNQSWGSFRRPAKKRSGNMLDHWKGTQKRTLLSALLFLFVFFSANSTDPFSGMIHSMYRSGMDSGNYYQALNGMAKEALSLGGVTSTSTPVDAKMLGRFSPPISGPVMAAFGEEGEGGSNPVGSIHEGIDVGSALGTSVTVPADGVVTIVGEDAQLGKIVKVEFGDGWTIVLGNLGEIYVQQGQRVFRGDVLGTVGLTAPLRKPWLHFELRKNSQAVDPIPYLIPPQSVN